MSAGDHWFQVVHAGFEHLHSVVSLFDQYRVFYGQPADWLAAHRFILDRLNRNDSVIYLALAKGSDRLAFGFVQLYPSFSSITMKKLWILSDLFVAPEARNQGVARTLMERACKLAVDTGAKGIVLETAIDNYSAQALYEDLGYNKDNEFLRYHLYL